MTKSARFMLFQPWCAFFKTLVEKRERIKLRAIMRGYRILKSQHKLDTIRELKSALSAENFDYIEHNASKIMFGAAIKYPLLITKQYLHVRILNNNFNKAILYSVGTGRSIKYPLPIEWRKQLKQYGYKVSDLSCITRWFFFLLTRYCFGVYLSLNVLKVMSGGVFKEAQNHRSKFVYFDFFVPHDSNTATFISPSDS